MVLIIFILFLAMLFGLLILGASTVQSFFIKYSYLMIDQQPYAQHFLTRQTFLLLILLEAPLILISVGLGMLSAIFFKYEMATQMIFFGLLALFSLCLIALFTIYLYKKPAQYFLHACALHPLEGPKYINSSIFLLSLMQTPLIFSLVIFFIGFFLFSGIVNFFSEESIFKSIIWGSAIFGTTISSIGVCLGISIYIKSIAHAGSLFPDRFSAYVKHGLLACALIEAPLIFSILISLLMITKIFILNIVSVIIISFVGILFSSVSSYLSYTSALIASQGIYFIDKEGLDIKKGMSLSFLSQLFLDARLLYLFVIVIIILYQYIL